MSIFLYGSNVEDSDLQSQHFKKRTKEIILPRVKKADYWYRSSKIRIKKDDKKVNKKKKLHRVKTHVFCINCWDHFVPIIWNKITFFQWGREFFFHRRKKIRKKKRRRRLLISFTFLGIIFSQKNERELKKKINPHRDILILPPVFFSFCELFLSSIFVQFFCSIFV